MMRFEEPNSNQRWDSPLIVVHPQDELPYDQISDALFNRKPPPPNMATQNVINAFTQCIYFTELQLCGATDTTKLNLFFFQMCI